MCSDNAHKHTHTDSHSQTNERTKNLDGQSSIQSNADIVAPNIKRRAAPHTFTLFRVRVRRDVVVALC